MRVAEQGYLAPLDHGAGSSCRSLYARALMFPPKLSSHIVPGTPPSLEWRRAARCRTPWARASPAAAAACLHALTAPAPRCTARSYPPAWSPPPEHTQPMNDCPWRVPSAATIYCFPSGASTILPALARQFTTFIRDMSAIASGATAARTDFTALSLVPRCDGSIAWCSGHEGLGWWMCKQAFLADFGARAGWAPMHARTHPPTHIPTHPLPIIHHPSYLCRLPPADAPARFVLCSLRVGATRVTGSPPNTCC
jgi:hypothetical protein